MRTRPPSFSHPARLDHDLVAARGSSTDDELVHPTVVRAWKTQSMITCELACTWMTSPSIWSGVAFVVANS